MKWGVRRYQPYSKGKHGTFLGQSRDEDIKISKGTKAYRVQREDTLSGEGQAYVSFDMFDNLTYVTSASAGWGVAMQCTTEGADKKGNKGYALTLALENDLIAPSYQKTMDAFIDTMKDVGIKQFINDVIGNGNRKSDEVKAFTKNLKHLTVDQARDDAYFQFSKSLFRDTESRKAFFSRLEKEGYNAIIDEADYRFSDGPGVTGFGGAAARTPVIVFSKADLKQTGKIGITDEDAKMFVSGIQGGTPDSNSKTAKKWKKYAGSSFDDFVQDQWY